MKLAFKAYAPKWLHSDHLAGMIDELGCQPKDVAKYLRVTERTVYRWLAEKSCPFACLSALRHETPNGREVTACDVGNELALTRCLARSTADARGEDIARVQYLIGLRGDYGSANDPFDDARFRTVANFQRPRPLMPLTNHFPMLPTENQTLSQG